MTENETCPACGYTLAVHQVAGTTIEPDPNGGCPANEAEAMIRWGC